MKIFVTGITGFIGRHLWEHFTPDDEIYILVRKATWKPILGLERLNVTVLEDDLSTPAGLYCSLLNIRPDVCLHLAWEGIPNFNYSTCLKNLKQSTELFQWLVERCGCKKIVSTGSCFEYRRSGTCHEYDYLRQDSYFAWAKTALMNFGMMLAHKHNTDFIWARLFYVYGEGQRIDSLIPNICQKLKSGETLVIKTPHSDIDFIHVKDVAKALIKMVRERNGTIDIFNIGSGSSIPVWKVCEIVEETMGIEPRTSEFLRSCDIPKEVSSFWADLTLIKSTLGWRPEITIREGIRDYIKNTT